MVSAALVAQREFVEEAAVAAEPSYDMPDISLAGPDPGKTESAAGDDASATGSTQPGEMAQKKKMMQHTIYFVSSLLQGARSRYLGVQKLLFGLLMASRKLRHYF